MNPKRYILALDQGTTSSRAIRFDREGRAVATAQKELAETDPALFGAAVPITGIAGDQQAATVGQACLRPEVTETTALGAAYLAGLEVGFWSGVDEIARHWRAARRFEPALSETDRRSRLDRWHQAVERARGWELPLAAAGSS